MSFPATITITIAPSTDRVLNRVNQDSYGSEYAYASGTEAISMKIRHSVDSVDADGIVHKRHNVFLERIVYPTPSTNMEKYSTTFTMRHGKYNDPTKAATLSDGVADWLIASTNLADLAAGIN